MLQGLREHVLSLVCPGHLAPFQPLLGDAATQLDPWTTVLETWLDTLLSNRGPNTAAQHCLSLDELSKA